MIRFYIKFANNIFIIGNNGLILTSENGGILWKSNNLINQTFNSIIMYDKYSGYIIGNNGIVYKISDGINGILVTNINITNNLYGIYSYDKDNIVIVGDNGLVIQSLNKSTSWNILTSGSYETFLSIYKPSIW